MQKRLMLLVILGVIVLVSGCIDKPASAYSTKAVCEAAGKYWIECPRGCFGPDCNSVCPEPICSNVPDRENTYIPPPCAETAIFLEQVKYDTHTGNVSMKIINIGSIDIGNFSITATSTDGISNAVIDEPPVARRIRPGESTTLRGYFPARNEITAFTIRDGFCQDYIIDFKDVEFLQ